MMSSNPGPVQGPMAAQAPNQPPSKFTEVTDPNILAQLNAGSTPAPNGFKEVTDPAILSKLNAPDPGSKPESPDTDFASKALAASTGLVQGGLKGIGQTAAAIPNVMQAVVEHGLNLLASHGIAPQSLADKYASGRKNINDIEAKVGNKILDFQGKVGAADMKANPTISSIADTAGNLIVSSVLAGKVFKGLGEGMAPITGGMLNQGAQGALMGASGNTEEPLKGAAEGGALGSVLGSIGGFLGKSSNVINSKLDAAKELGKGPMSEEAIRSTKEALATGGKELLQEQGQQNLRKQATSMISSLNPEVDFSTRTPADVITAAAKQNFGVVKETKNSLYQPLNEATQAADTATTTKALSEITNKTAQGLLPEAPTANSTISDLMDYRRNVRNAVDQAERAIQNGSTKINFQTVKQLSNVYDSVTNDLGAAADKAGLSGQLQKADTYYAQNYLPFKVFNKDGQVATAEQTSQTWDKVTRLLSSKFPNSTAMSKVVQSLGPEGKQLFGQAFLQNSVMRASDFETGGLKLNPNSLTTELNKIANRGMDTKLFTPEVQEAFNGLRSLTDAAKKTLKMSSDDGSKQGAVGKIIKHVVGSSGGITLLRLLGSHTTPTAKMKNLAGQIIANGLEKQAGEPQQ